MSENTRLHAKALYQFDHVVRSARDAADWDRPSPCAGWTARDVLGHVLAIQAYFCNVIDGKPMTMNPMENPGVHAGADPAAAWAAVRDDVLEHLDRPGVVHATITNYFGQPEGVDHMVGFNVLDLTVHAWDLARALGTDDRLDPATVAKAWDIVKDRADQMRNPMQFGARVALGENPSPTEVLLAATGRTR